MKEKDINSLEHTKWIGKILRKLCEQKGVNICRSGSVSRPHTHAHRNTAKIQCSTNHGISKRKE